MSLTVERGRAYFKKWTTAKPLFDMDEPLTSPASIGFGSRSVTKVDLLNSLLSLTSSEGLPWWLIRSNGRLSLEKFANYGDVE